MGHDEAGTFPPEPATTIAELRQRAQNAWDNLLQDKIRHLYDHLHTRIHACIAAREGYTVYWYDCDKCVSFGLNLLSYTPAMINCLSASICNTMNLSLRVLHFSRQCRPISWLGQTLGLFSPNQYSSACLGILPVFIHSSFQHGYIILFSRCDIYVVQSLSLWTRRKASLEYNLEGKTRITSCAWGDTRHYSTDSHYYCATRGHASCLTLPVIHYCA